MTRQEVHTNREFQAIPTTLTMSATCIMKF